ncbi:MAG TPA: D-alanyl-D-alanine carboxypeptidase family protein [Bacilli bacterium]
MLPHPAAAAPQKPVVHAEAAALIDVTSGRLLYSLNGEKQMRIASLTKIMTAIVAIEAGDLADKVKVGAKAYGVEGSSVYLKRGEEISLENLLYGLMLRSGNDAAVAIAEHVGGSVDGFVKMMNDKAQEIGMRHTHFANPHGLDAPDHYSTAADLARLAAYALHNATFRNIVKTKLKTVPDPGQPWDRTWINKNKMLSLYEGADGVKTGYTKKAGRCLVSSATRGGQQLAVVTLNDPVDWADHRILLDYGLANYPLREIVAAGQPVKNTGYIAAKSFRYPLRHDEEGALSYRINRHAAQSLSYRLGWRGNVEIRLHGETIGIVPLIPAADTSAAEANAARASVSGRALSAYMRALRMLITFQESE